MTSITASLEHWAAIQPDRALFGFVGADGSATDGYTYGEFLERSHRLAAQLRATLIAPRGERVLLAYAPGLDIALAFFACARLGLIPVPVMPPDATNFSAAMSKLDLIAADCQARAILSSGTLCELVRSRAWPTPQPGWIATDGAPDAGAAALDPVPDSAHPILFLQYTSGSTGKPRGVMVSHANVIDNARATIDHVPVGVSWLPQYHDMGLIGYYLFPVVCGGTTHGIAPLDFLRRPALWLQLISRVRATYASSPNFGFEYCLQNGKVDDAQLHGVELGSLRILMNAAEPVRAITRERFIARFARHGLDPAACVVAYGLAENTLAATHYGRRTIALNKAQFQQRRVQIAATDASADSTMRLASCGRPLDGVSLRIVDAQARHALGEREIGEIWLAGASTAVGYWDDAALTSEVFGQRLALGEADQRGYLRTGDLGFMHDGELFVCGRSKDLIIVRGVNHYPQDIEAIVEAVAPCVRSGGVAAFQGHDETLVVLVEVRRWRTLPNPAALAHAIQQRALVLPDTVVLVPPGSIVRTTSGKVARRLTRDRFLLGAMCCLQTYQTPAPSGRTLRDRLRTLVARCGATDTPCATLAELGLDSLTLTELLLDLEHLLLQRGGAALAGEVDLALLQRLTIAQFEGLLHQIERGDAIAGIASGLRHLRARFDTGIGERMRCDARLQTHDLGTVEAQPMPVSQVLMTGATGFFGPFLLASLLRQTPHTYHVLVRATDGAHALQRLRDALAQAALTPVLEGRVHMVCGDIALPDLGLPAPEWNRLARQIHSVVHNAAAVNYVANYEALKPHNVDGTRTLLRFAHSTRRKQFHFISSTFIFGWTARGLLRESDNNDEMVNLDFGYAQTKWVAEQLVLAAGERGLDARIYRPSLVSTSTAGIGDRDDVAVRLLAFMIKHGIAVDTTNQLSILAADVAADNIAAIVGQHDLPAKTFHVTVDNYYNMVDLTRLLTREHGYHFTYHDIPGFIAEMNRRCTQADPLYPLLDFFNRSATKIAAMQLKRYRNERYHEARSRSGNGRDDPTLTDTVASLVAYLLGQGLIGAAAPAQPDGTDLPLPAPPEHIKTV